MSDGDGAQPWGERSEFTLLRWCFSRRCDTGSLQEEEGQRCRWGVRSHLHLQLLSTPLSSCFFIRLGFQAKVRQTGGRNVMQCPEATGRRAWKNLWNWWEIFFFISLFLYKTRNLNQVCNTDSTVWYMTELTSLYNNHPTVTTAQLRAIFQSNQFCFFLFFLRNTTRNYSPIISAPRDYSTVQLPWHTVACELLSIITLFRGAQYNLQCS